MSGDKTLVSDLPGLCEEIGERLRGIGGRLVTVESCTGGGIAWFLTSIAGSSDWFDRALVTYSNQAKSELAGVPMGLIDRAGAVSEETAYAMAEGGLADPLATHALSVTGIAGPGGGSPEKPVGMVCFAWAVAEPMQPDGGLGHAIRTDTQYFAGDRHEIRMATIAHALGRLRDLLL
jgi:nicotinamide-nucleotide amidase